MKGIPKSPTGSSPGCPEPPAAALGTTGLRARAGCPGGGSAGDGGGSVPLQAEAAPCLQGTAAVQTAAVLVLLKFIIFII